MPAAPKIWKLDSAGKIAWSRDLSTGSKPPGYADYQSIVWNGLAHDPAGRIIIGGFPQHLPPDDPVSDSLALVVLGPDGTLLWSKRFPLDGPGEPVARGHWELLALSAGDDGIRVRLYRQGMHYWKTLDTPWSGPPSAKSRYPRLPALRSASSGPCPPRPEPSWGSAR